MADEPSIRASDADRERVASRLRAAAGEGRLSVDELEERVDAAYAARTAGELEPLVADLPAAPASAGAGGGAVVRPGEGGTSRVISILGGSDRFGRWRVAPRCTVVNVLGGSDIDLNDAELAAEETEIRVWSFLGGGDIYVPEGLDVHVSEVGILGGNTIKLGEGRPSPGAPRLHLRLVSVLGGCDVHRGRKVPLRQRWHAWRHGHGHRPPEPPAPPQPPRLDE